MFKNLINNIKKHKKWLIGVLIIFILFNLIFLHFIFIEYIWDGTKYLISIAYLANITLVLAIFFLLCLIIDFIKIFNWLKGWYKKEKFKAYLIIISLLAVTLVLYYLFSIKKSFKEEITNPSAPHSIRNIVLALVALSTGIFTWWKNVINHNTNEINQAKCENTINLRNDELFAKGVQLLSKNNDINIKGLVFID